MFTKFIKPVVVTCAIMAGSAVSAAQFVIELEEPLAGDNSALKEKLDVVEVERFDAAGKSYIVLDAKDQPTLASYLEAQAIDPLKVKPVSFVNSPEIGGGTKAGDTPRPGHQSYVIERPVPGIGGLSLETQKQLSMGSNAALEQIGDGIEWVHSYLTDEGTYCVYRAVDTDKIVEHGKLSNFPINTIAAVAHSKPAK